MVVQSPAAQIGLNTAAVLALASKEADFVCVQPHEDLVETDLSSYTSRCGAKLPSRCSSFQ